MTTNQNAFLASLWTPPLLKEDEYRNAKDTSIRVVTTKLNHELLRQHRSLRELQLDMDRQRLALNAILDQLSQTITKAHYPVIQLHKLVNEALSFFSEDSKSSMKQIEQSKQKLEALKDEIQTLQTEYEHAFDGYKPSKRKWFSRVKSTGKQVAAFLGIRKRQSVSLRKKRVANNEQKTEVRNALLLTSETRMDAYTNEVKRFIDAVKRQWNVHEALAIETLKHKQQKIQGFYKARVVEIEQHAVNMSVLLSRYNEMKREILLQKQTPNKSSTFPEPFRLDFASKIAQMFPSYRMDSVVSGPSRCHPGEIVLQSYQYVIPSLLHPQSPYPGFLAAFEPGSGKTAMALQAVRLHIDQFRFVTVLLPSEVLFAAWALEMQKWLSKDFEIKLERKENTSQLWSLTRGGKNKQIYHILLHKILVALPSSMVRRVRLASDYVLFETLPKNLPKNARNNMQSILAAQKQAVLKRKIGLVPGGLLIVDEAHYLTNAGEICRSVSDSLTVLAWANYIAQLDLHHNKVLLMSGTSNDVESPLPLIKLMNLLVPSQRKLKHYIAYEGLWKRSLSKDEQKEKDKTELYDIVNTVESLHFQTLYFNSHPVINSHTVVNSNPTWKSGTVLEFQRNYGSLLFYVTLSNDPTRFGRVDKRCNSCAFMWDESKHEMHDVTNPKLFGVPFPADKNVRLVFVPMAKTQYQHLHQAMQADAKRFNIPIHELSYGKKDLKSSVLSSFGTKFYQNEPNPKIDSLLTLIEHNYKQKEKTFAFSVSLDHRFAKNLTQFFQDSNFEVLTLESAKVQKEKPTWIDSMLQKKRKRVIVLIASAKIAESMSPEDIHDIRTALIKLWNAPQNLHGEYVCGFIGGRNTNTGLSLLTTFNTVLLDVSSTMSMETQAIARTFRNCGLEPFPTSKWNTMKVWQFVSVPYKGKKSARENENENKTNEQYHYVALRNKRATSLSERLWEILLPASADCELMHRYNGIPKKCVSLQKPIQQKQWNNTLDTYIMIHQIPALYVAAQNRTYDLTRLSEIPNTTPGVIIGQFPATLTFVDNWIREYFDDEKKKNKSKNISRFNNLTWGGILLSLWTTPRTFLTKARVWQALDDFPSSYQRFLKHFVESRFMIYPRVYGVGLHSQTKGKKTDEKHQLLLYRELKKLYHQYQHGLERFVVLAS